MAASFGLSLDSLHVRAAKHESNLAVTVSSTVVIGMLAFEFGPWRRPRKAVVAALLYGIVVANRLAIQCTRTESEGLQSHETRTGGHICGYEHRSQDIEREAASVADGAKSLLINGFGRPGARALTVVSMMSFALGCPLWSMTARLRFPA